MPAVVDMTASSYLSALRRAGSVGVALGKRLRQHIVGITLRCDERIRAKKCVMIWHSAKFSISPEGNLPAYGC